MDSFFFIGVVEKPEDFLFLYHLLGIKKFIPKNINVSKKYFIPKDPEELKAFILSKCDFDQQIYEKALELNKKFKKTCPDFKEIVNLTEKKRENYFKKKGFLKNRNPETN